MHIDWTNGHFYCVLDTLTQNKKTIKKKLRRKVFFFFHCTHWQLASRAISRPFISLDLNSPHTQNRNCKLCVLQKCEYRQSYCSHILTAAVIGLLASKRFFFRRSNGLCGFFLFGLYDSLHRNGVRIIYPTTTHSSNAGRKMITAKFLWPSKNIVARRKLAGKMLVAFGSYQLNVFRPSILYCRQL